MKQGADELLKLYASFKDHRIQYESTWNDITDLVVPNRNKFTEEDATRFTPDTELYDSTAVQSNEQLAATLLNGLVNQETKWFDLDFEDPQFKNDDRLKRLLELRSDQMYDLFNAADSGFYTNVAEMFLDLSAYGTAAMESHYVAGEGIKFKAVHLSGLYIATDKSGFVDTVFRRFEFTARQAAQMWGEESLGANMRKSLIENPYKRFEIIRCVKPEENYSKKVTTKNKFYSAYISVTDNHILSEGGLKHFPYVVPRWTKLTNEDYGRSPAWTALPDIIMVQAMEMAILEVAQKVADPQLMVADEGVMLPINPEAGGLIFGGIDPITGRARVQPLHTGGNVQVYDAFLERKKDAIRRAFYNNSLNSQDLPQMTAEEVATRRDENFRMIAPNANRVLLEAISPLVMNTYHLMNENNLFEELPEDLKDFLKDKKLKVRFSGPLSRTTKIQESNAWLRYLNAYVLPYAQIDPTVLDTINTARSMEIHAENLGVPLKTLNTESERLAIQQQREEQQAIAMQAQLAAQADQAEAQAPQEQEGPADDGTI